MKNIFKILFLLLIVFTLNSCEKERDKATPISNGFTFSTEIAPSTSLITPANSNSVFNKVVWTKADNGVNGVVDYKFQLADHDKDPNFLRPVEYSGSGLIFNNDVRSCKLTNLELNSLLNSLETFVCGQMNIDIRIKSTLGTSDINSFSQYSNVINFLVTGYSTKIPELQFTNGTTTAKLASTSYLKLNDFEGYCYLTSGNYSFKRPDACGSYTNAVTLVDSAGVLSTSGNAISLSSGYYYIKADLIGSTYSVKPYTSFGIIGTATRNGIGTNYFVPMSAVSTNGNLWTVTIDLIPGNKFKFRNALWTGNPTTPTPINVPGSNPPTTVQNPSYIPNSSVTILNTLGKSLIPNELVYEDIANITATEITATGTYTTQFNRKNYTLTIDVSNPRAYTYTLKAN